MESPAYLVEQFAKERGLSENGAKWGMMLQQYSRDGATFSYACEILGISKATGP